VRARRVRLAQEELRREEHAQVVVERSGDPRFVQRVNHGDGSATVRWEAGTPADGMIREGVEGQRAAFRAKFGRDPGPDDPLLFDPDAEEPTFLTDQRMSAMFEEMIEGVESAGGDTALVKAWRDVGYIVTTETRHLFSAAEVAAWEHAVEGYLDEQAVDELVDEDDIDIGDLVEVLDAMLRDAVARTIADRSMEPARVAAEAIIAGDAAALRAAEPDRDIDEGTTTNAGLQSVNEEGALGLSMAFSVLAGWLTAMRESWPVEVNAEAAVAWVRAELGDAPAAAAGQAAGLLASGAGADVTVQELLDELQEDFLPALVWLAAGALVRFGGGDVTCLPSPLDEELDDPPRSSP
jgi:hypothetical protein